jgi:hypothetical protein
LTPGPGGSGRLVTKTSHNFHSIVN